MSGRKHPHSQLADAVSCAHFCTCRCLLYDLDNLTILLLNSTTTHPGTTEAVITPTCTYSPCRVAVRAGSP
eukprot:scaffold48550_cov68-Phaeocystis_antarctica.AAC.8